MNIEIKDRWTGKVLFSYEADSIRKALLEAIKVGADLSGADLSGANLSGANLSGAYLSGANLSGANLYGANLSRANLSGAYLPDAYLSRANLSGASLSGANLSGANLSGAYLSGAYLSRAYLSRANLSGADLSGADLSGANLSGANLSGAYLSGAYLSRAYLYGASLSGANLSGANLSGAKGIDVQPPQTKILPEGDLIGWKKCGDGVLVKLLIPSDAKRSNASGRKCRAEFVKVLEVIGGDVGITTEHGPRTEYKVGEIVKPDKWDPDWKEECSNGIHFFITKEEAEQF